MKSTNYVYRMKLTGYQVRTAIGILNERRLALKSQGCTLENSEEYVGVFNLLSRFLDLLPADQLNIRNQAIFIPQCCGQ